jgi:drug/metabolite transporter (DMT)-like permease
MFALLALYAFLWQKIIASIPIAVAYANKSAYLVWTQLGALVLFHEKVSLMNWLGLAIVLAGVLLVNRGAHD